MKRLAIADPTKRRPASKCMRVLAAVICSGIAAPRALSQTGNANQGVRIIKGSWGTAPGQYAWKLVMDDAVYPQYFAVDSDEQIYVLDEFNNRVQHYDGAGNLLGEIPIQSDAPPTAIQKKRDQQNERSIGADPIERGIEIGGMRFVDGALYAVQEIAYMGVGGRPKENILKMSNDRFVVVAVSSESARVLKVMTSSEDTAAKARILFKGDPKLQMKPSGPYCGYYDGNPIAGILVDNRGNRWVMGSVDRKYSPKGELLFQGPPMGFGSSYEVSPDGIYYVLSVYSDDKDAPLDFQGIEIVRYQTK